MTPDRDLSPGQPRTDDTEFHLPEDHSPLPELVHTERPHGEPGTAAFVALSQRTEYTNLRSTFRRFAFPMTVAGLVSYFTYVVLSIYAVGFMSTPLIGHLTVGMSLGLAQFAVVYVWTFLYVRFMSTRIDPTSQALKAQLEKGAGA